jgi:hypothetical protein
MRPDPAFSFPPRTVVRSTIRASRRGTTRILGIEGMMTMFTHDVAISAVSYDSLLVGDLFVRLGLRLSAPVFWQTELADAGAEPRADSTAAAVFERSARIVVVLHQRLWGREGGTSADVEALRERVRAKQQKTICVVTLDSEPVPAWLAGAPRFVMSELGAAGVVAAVADAVAASGAKVAAAAVASTAEPIKTGLAWNEAQPYMNQPRAQTALRRELDTLTTELASRVKAVSADRADGSVEFHSSPQRLVVQLGSVGLSLSWVAARSGNLSDGRLLVIEWAGSITHGRGMGGSKTASPTHEQSFRPEAKGPEDWCWRAEGTVGTSYSSRDLAGQYFSSAALTGLDNATLAGVE